MDNVQTAPALEWKRISADLDEFGVALTGPLLNRETGRALRSLYADDDRFRSRILMQRHRFGSGEYKYFANPLPGPVRALREMFYENLAPIADRWNERMGIGRRYPARLDDFLAECHADGQTKPTPLLLKYGVGDYNCLHQDVYGRHLFPIQLVILLSEPGEEFSGGEFVLTEQCPRRRALHHRHHLS